MSQVCNHPVHENPVYEKLKRCLHSVQEKVDFVPAIALVLGSGLGNYGEQIRVVQTVDYHEIEGFPVSTVQGHKGRFLFGYIEDVPVVAMRAGCIITKGTPCRMWCCPSGLCTRLGRGSCF